MAGGGAAQCEGRKTAWPAAERCACRAAGGGAMRMSEDSRLAGVTFKAVKAV
jgi:hypothetical protein